ncbi:ATP-dependent DNA helicase [Humibacter sp.]|uniref:ATP-dependent DNA helicase n=1 Tax=Humibacter sp. TaxID=1940291 RepID=UPI002BD8A8BE|nr:AAA family ATPase [Humibacter sp.]HVX09118.1 AAA family ATPase [Humibacter sp.]
MDEDDWAAIIRDEIHTTDPTMTARAAVAVTPVNVADIDLDLVAAKAVVDADGRSTGTGGRFSVFDVRAGVLRALSSTGLVTDRDDLTSLVDELVQQAVAAHTVRLLNQDEVVPDHVKHLVASETVVAKYSLANQLSLFPESGEPLPTEAVQKIAAVVDPGRALDSGQIDGARDIAGTNTLVTVIGAAGTGKTTMLKVAATALKLQNRRMVVVAPTKKAATVAGREVGSDSSSLHQLLHACGWRWNEDASGRTVWSRLAIGEIDPTTQQPFDGVPDEELQQGDRIVIDEAGMLDLDTANALVQLARETGTGIAAVGDPNQALPVGHSGAMALLRHNSAEMVELLDVHRFKDHAWGRFTIELRRAQTAADRQSLANRLVETGHVQLADNTSAAESTMTDAWFDAMSRRETISLITSTHAEAQAVSEAIQARRLKAGALATGKVAVGQAGQTLLEGDVVQTRRNNRSSGVENRQNWILHRITNEGLVLASVNDSTQFRKVSHDYAAQHIHLGYASTVYGAQGETTDRSLVGPGVDAAGLYVGLTRGRLSNNIVLTAPTPKAAAAELTEMMQRGSIESTIDASRTAARDELHRAAAPLSAGQAGPGRKSAPEPSL